VGLLRKAKPLLEVLKATRYAGAIFMNREEKEEKNDFSNG